MTRIQKRHIAAAKAQMMLLIHRGKPVPDRICRIANLKMEDVKPAADMSEATRLIERRLSTLREDLSNLEYNHEMKHIFSERIRNLEEAVQILQGAQK